ncbi:hypothetical protein ACWOAN_00605 [Lactococcus taiwanensis]|uniref:hypothetical protein n=1 Tax=Lactococcus taiwanensis TaxID=1151742 RepID=UPI001903DECC|nr:hypothetical protein [Lactococcus taiwanensis]
MTLNKKPINIDDLNKSVNNLNRQREDWLNEINNDKFLAPVKKPYTKKESKQYKEVSQAIDKLLEDDNKSIDAELIFQIAKRNLESGLFDPSEAEDYIIHELLMITTTPGKRGISDVEREYINNRRKTNGLKGAVISVIGLTVLFLAWAVRMRFLK